MSPRCSSASASRVVVRLTKYTAAPIDTTANAALARKIRLVSDPRMVTRLSQCEIRFDGAAVFGNDDGTRFADRTFVPCDERIASGRDAADLIPAVDRKSTRLNSSHSQISYAVFCLKKKKKQAHVR